MKLSNIINNDDVLFCGTVDRRKCVKPYFQSGPLLEILPNSLPVTTPSTSLLMETGIWPAKERTEYSTLMLIHSIINSNRERISQKIILEQKKKGITDVMHERAKEIGESIGMNIDQAEKMKKSTWKREVKTKIKEKNTTKTNR